MIETLGLPPTVLDNPTSELKLEQIHVEFKLENVDQEKLSAHTLFLIREKVNENASALEILKTVMEWCGSGSNQPL